MMILNVGFARDERAGRAEVRDWPEAGNGRHTVIHSDLTVAGELVTDGHIEVEGVVEGTINSRTVMVREGGHVEGTILAEAVYIRGSVHGPVRANTVRVGSTARVVGNIFHHSLTVEPGAYIDGRRPWRPRIDRERESA